MDEDVTDGQLIDLRHIDPASLVAKADDHDHSLKTALDRVFASASAGCFGFNNYLP